MYCFSPNVWGSRGGPTIYKYNPITTSPTKTKANAITTQFGRSSLNTFANFRVCLTPKHKNVTASTLDTGGGGGRGRGCTRHHAWLQSHATFQVEPVCTCCMSKSFQPRSLCSRCCPSLSFSFSATIYVEKKNTRATIQPCRDTVEAWRSYQSGTRYDSHSTREAFRVSTYTSVCTPFYTVFFFQMTFHSPFCCTNLFFMHRLSRAAGSSPFLVSCVAHDAVNRAYHCGS